MRKLAIVFLVLFFMEGCLSRRIVTYTSKVSETLSCAYQNGTSTINWSDVTGGGNQPIFQYIPAIPQVDNNIFDAKYGNFDYTITPTSFDLLIEDVGKDDGGIYRCALSGVGAGSTDTKLNVEVLGDVAIFQGSIKITALKVNVSDSYELTCKAIGAKSDNPLTLVWTASQTEETVPSINKDDSELMDYTSTINFSPGKQDTSINCTISGYMNDEDIQRNNADDVTGRVMVAVQFPPTTTPDDDHNQVPRTTTPDDDNNQDKKNNTGLIVVIIVVLVVFIVGSVSLIVIVIWVKPDAPLSKRIASTLTRFCIAICCWDYWKNRQNKDKKHFKFDDGENDTELQSEAVPPLDKPDSGNGTEPEIPAYGVVHKSFTTTDDVGSDSKSTRPGTEPPTYGVVNKKNSSGPSPSPAHRNIPSEKDEMQLQYAELDHGKNASTVKVHQPQDEPTEYSTVQSVIV